MLRDEYLRRLIDAAHVDLYLSGTDGARIYWPWRMQPEHEATQTYRNACEHFIIDSAPQREDITTKDVLDTAYNVDAEVASLQDVYLNCDATIDSLLKGLELADSHIFEGRLLLPLQEPFVKCYREIGSPTEHMIGIGGLKGASNAARIKAAKTIREIAPNIHLHGFGWGPTEDLAAEIRRSPDLLDSIDYSTPLQTAINTKMTPGDERMSVLAAYAAYRLIRDLREVTPFPNELETLEGAQGGLADFA